MVKRGARLRQNWRLAAERGSSFKCHGLFQSEDTTNGSKNAARITNS